MGYNKQLWWVGAAILLLFLASNNNAKAAGNEQNRAALAKILRGKTTLGPGDCLFKKNKFKLFLAAPGMALARKGIFDREQSCAAFTDDNKKGLFPLYLALLDENMQIVEILKWDNRLNRVKSIWKSAGRSVRTMPKNPAIPHVQKYKF